MLLTFGLLSPSKGIEYVIRALPEITRQHPDLIYIVLGATHPNLVRTEGERYRLSLERLAAKLGMQQHVTFYNRFVELEELKQFIGAADIYVTPYLNKAQITSGTLCYAFGCGKAVISTPYWHAEELLADGRGVLVPFQDSAVHRDGGVRSVGRRGAPRCDVRTGLPAGPRDDLEPRRPSITSPRSARRVPTTGITMAVGSRSRPWPSSRRAARAHAGSPGAADRFDRHLPARGLRDAQLRRGLLHGRQRARPPADGPARAIAPRLAGAPAACDHVFRLRPARLRPRQPPLSQLHELRSPLAGRGRFRRLLRALPVGAGHRAWGGPSTAASRSGRPSSSCRPCRSVEP